MIAELFLMLLRAFNRVAMAPENKIKTVRAFLAVSLVCWCVVCGHASADTTLVRLVGAQMKRADTAFAGLAVRAAVRSSHNDSVQLALDSFVAVNQQFSLVVRGDTSGIIRAIVGAGRSDSVSLADLTTYPRYERMKSVRHSAFIAKDSVRFRLCIGNWLKTKNKSNAGILIAEVNLRTLFKDVAKEYTQPFKAVLDSVTVFRGKWKDSLDAGADIDTVRSADGALLQIFTVGTKIVSDLPVKPKGDTVVPATPPKEGLDAQRLIARNDSLLRANSSVVEETRPEQQGRGAGSMMPIVLILAVVVVLVIVAVRVIRKNMLVSGGVVNAESFEESATDQLQDRNRIRELVQTATAEPPVSADSKPVPASESEPHDEITLITDEARDEITGEVSESLKQAVIAQLREEIRRDVTESESPRLREEVREDVRKDFAAAIARDEREILVREVRAALTEDIRTELKIQIEQTVELSERGVLERRARDELRKSIDTRLRQEVMPAIEVEVREELKQSLEIRVRQENEKRLKDECLRELEDRVRQVVSATQAEGITRQVRSEISTRIRCRLELEEGKQLEVQERTLLAQDVARQIRDSEYDSICERQRAILQEEIRRRILAEDMPVLTDAQRESIAREVRQNLIDEFHEQILKTEREILRQDLHDQVVRDESDAIRTEETAKIRQALVHELEGSRAGVMAELRTAFENTVKEELTRTAAEGIRASARESLLQQARRELAEKDKSGIISEARTLCARDVLAEMPATQVDAIRDQVYDSVVEEERQKIVLRELPQISRSLREELTVSQREALRIQAIAEIKEKELPRIRAQVNAEVESEVRQRLEIVMRSEFEAHSRSEVERVTRDISQRLQLDFTARVIDGYQGLFTHIESARTLLGDTAVLNSLNNTLGLLEEEKSKYKYFNLNMAQTDSMIEYMRRLSKNLEQYFEKLDGQLRQTIEQLNESVNQLKNS